jgi:hypothetical protein
VRYDTGMGCFQSILVFTFQCHRTSTQHLKATVIKERRTARAHPGEGCCRAAAPHPPQDKKNRFCKHDDIKIVTLLTLQPKSATEIVG